MEGNGEYRGVNLGTDGLSGGPSPQSAGYPEYRSKEFLASLLILIPYLSLKSVSLTLKSFILTTQIHNREGYGTEKKVGWVRRAQEDSGSTILL